jgi:hypothetical protein
MFDSETAEMENEGGITSTLEPFFMINGGKRIAAPKNLVEGGIVATA